MLNTNETSKVLENMIAARLRQKEREEMKPMFTLSCSFQVRGNTGGSVTYINLPKAVTLKSHFYLKAFCHHT